MAKAAKKTAKKRTKAYDPKLAISGSFEDVIKVSVTSGKLYKSTPTKPKSGKK